jgi:exodeoxyribonuclease VII small subunit
MAKNFESAMKRLEQIVDELENGDLTLEASIKIYEEGVELMTFCTSKLDLTEKKIQILQKKGNRFSVQTAESQDDDQQPVT